MSYTINPNAKNKWARNAENTMDLSLETDASSVYLDNGSTLEQEIGEGSMVSNVTTVDTSMSKIIDGTLDGAYESLVFKGKSLVNIHPISYAIGAAGAVTYFANNDVDKTKIKSGTRYFLRLLDTDPTVCRAYFKPCNVNTISFADINDKYAIFTTKSELTDSDFSNNKIHFYTSTSKTLEDVANTKIILCEYQEGMENWDIPYFTGLCDVKMPILRNVGKNLFDKNTMKTSWWINQDGVKKDSGNTNYSILVPATQNKVYSVSFDVSNRSFYAFLDKDYNTLLLQTGYVTKTAPQGTKYLLYYLHSENIDLCGDIQLEEATAKTAHEDYKTNILRTSEEIVLRSLPNGVCDTFNTRTGIYTQRIGETVLKGGEDERWTLGGWWTPQVETIGFEKPLSVKSESSLNNAVVSGPFDHITFTDVEYIGVSARWECLGIRIARSKLPTEDIEGLKVYLSQKPVTVQYELVTPITTTIEPLSIPFAYENGHIILESGFEGQSLLPTLEYSTVINRVGQIQSIANTIQKQEKQITKLEQMLIQNIVDLDYNNTLLTLKNEMEEML